MKFTLSINTDNDAFEGAPEIEVARILREVAAKISTVGLPDSYRNMTDINGNIVGTYVHREDYSLG